MNNNVTMTAVDGTDALAFVVIRPGKTEGGVEIEAVANGMSQPGAAYVLRHVANQWDGGGDDPSATISSLNTLAEKLEEIVAQAPRHPQWMSEDPLSLSGRTEHDRAVAYRNAARAIRHVLCTGDLPDDLADDADLAPQDGGAS
ncbi:hypothetical protein [Streptomyces sp. NPDC046821]|uniref:hypothetical protein n=1 Tax=Streptomyces sp. NPDC046821 TaxID=3154702 RepID=UPI0033EFCE71